MNAVSTPFAFVLVKWADEAGEPITLDQAKVLFTETGRGRSYLVDWFTDNTHGHVDMSGNQVFGWLRLPETLAEHQAKKPTDGRARVVGLARQAAADAQIDLSGFAGVIVVTNRFSDLYGGFGPPGYVETTAERGPGHRYWESKISPSVLCQEVIHALGVYNHSRARGAGDYTDPYDVMSMFAAYAGTHPEDPELSIGPGLNAAFMDRCGWLSTGRTQTVTEQSEVVQLRPLHRRDLPGPLCARVGTWFVEYRPKQRWDVGVPASVVLVHERADDTSFLLAALSQGGIHTTRQPDVVWPDYQEVQVESIDDEALTASVRVTRVARPAPPTAGPAITLTGQLGDGGGLILVGGRIVRIPPRSPLLAPLAQLATLQEAADLASRVDVGTIVERAALEQVAVFASERLYEVAELHSPIERLADFGPDWHDMSC